MQLSDNLVVKVLWGNEGGSAAEGLSDNDKSLVMLLEYGGRNVIFCGDIGERIQKKLISDSNGLKADIIVAAHHGSRKTFCREFMEAVGAEIVICSCGRSDYENGRVITKEDLDAELRYTGLEGAIQVVIKREGEISCCGYKKSPHLFR